jgi:AcrR family transcriptional regulator
MRAAPTRAVGSSSDELTAEHTERERKLLKVARQLLRDGGYDNLNLKVLAEKAGIARVTVYKHFSNRQDVILKLSIRSVARRADMIEKAALFRGLTRERIVAVASVIRHCLPGDLRHEVLAYEKGIAERASPELRQQLRSHEDRILAVLIGVIREAVVARDVTLPADLPPERLGLAIMHLETGAQVLMQRAYGYGRFCATDSLLVLNDFGDLLLDDLDWKPLSREHNFPATERRVWMELFPDQVKKYGFRCDPTA